MRLGAWAVQEQRDHRNINPSRFRVFQGRDSTGCVHIGTFRAGVVTPHFGRVVHELLRNVSELHLDCTSGIGFAFILQAWISDFCLSGSDLQCNRAGLNLVLIRQALQGYFVHFGISPADNLRYLELSLGDFEELISHISFGMQVYSKP